MVRQYVCCHLPREIKLISFFCFLLSIFSIAFVFCILLSAFLVVIAVHVCYGGRGGLAGASIDLIWAFSASGFDTLTRLLNLAYLAFIIFASIDLIWAFSASGFDFDTFSCLGIQQICGASIVLIWVLLQRPVADTLDFVVLLEFGVFVF